MLNVRLGRLSTGVSLVAERREEMMEEAESVDEAGKRREFTRGLY